MKADRIVSLSPGAYRVDTEHGVMRCDVVARFDNEEHASFLVELLQEGHSHD
jgi:hypothetical protein